MSQKKKIWSHKIFIIKENAGYQINGLEVKELSVSLEDKFSLWYPHGRSELPITPVPYSHLPLIGFLVLLKTYGTHKFMQSHAHTYKMNKQWTCLFSYIYVYHMYDCRITWKGVAYGFETPCGYWEPNQILCKSCLLKLPSIPQKTNFMSTDFEC